MARLAKGQDFSVYSSPSFNFWFDEKWYTVQGAKTMLRTGTMDDLSTMRAEYTRMRDVAQKRIKRLEKAFPESEAYKEHKQGFPKLRDIDPRDFPYAFSELAKFVRAKGSSVTGQRSMQEKTMNTLNKAIGAGVTDSEGHTQAAVTKNNYWYVIDVLHEVRRLKLLYGSETVVEYAEMILARGLDQEMWLSHLEALLPRMNEIKEIPDLQGYSFDELMKKINKKEEQESD